jgi:hypothetical protein
MTRFVKYAIIPLAVALFSASVASASDNPKMRHLGTHKDVIVQLFEWSWDSVAAECVAFIGPAGYAAVQGNKPGLELIPTVPNHDSHLSYVSEPSRGAHTGLRMDHELSNGLLQAPVKTRESRAVCKDGVGLPCRWSQSRGRLVPFYSASFNTIDSSQTRFNFCSILI